MCCQKTSITETKPPSNPISTKKCPPQTWKYGKRQVHPWHTSQPFTNFYNHISKYGTFYILYFSSLDFLFAKAFLLNSRLSLPPASFLSILSFFVHPLKPKEIFNFSIITIKKTNKPKKYLLPRTCYNHLFKIHINNIQNNKNTFL